MTTVAVAAKTATPIKRTAVRRSEELPSSTIVVMRRVALGIALTLWTVAAFAGQHYNTKTLYAIKCHPYSEQSYSKASMNTFGACRRL